MISNYRSFSNIKKKSNLHVEDDIVHELTEAGLDSPLELRRLHQGVDKLKDSKHQILKTQHLKSDLIRTHGG